MRVAIAMWGAAAMAASAGGCSSTYYDWGRYEESVHLVTNQPDGFHVAAEIHEIETQLEETRNKNRPVPPGAHAQLGYLMLLDGNARGARGNFEAEKSLFSESARFMDFLMGRLKAGT